MAGRHLIETWTRWQASGLKMPVRIVLLGILIFAVPLLGDTIEFNNGAKLNGTITKVDDAAQSVTINMTVRGRNYTRRYGFKDIRSITRNGQTRSLGSSATNATRCSGAGNSRSEQQIRQLITSTGRSLPDWYDSTRLNYPRSLDISWPKLPPNTQWNARKHIVHHLYSDIIPNQGRWREAMKFLHFVYGQNARNAYGRDQCARQLGRLYFEFFRDYPRAAYWLSQTRLTSNDRLHAVVAECYYRMGSQDMALQYLAGKPALIGTAKLLGAMGLTDRAVKVADAIAKYPRPREALLTAGDALALAGRYPDALKYYNQVLTDRRPERDQKYLNRYQTRARQSIASIQLYETLDVSKLRDGTYSESSAGYESPIRVEVKVASGRITSVRVTQHREKQYYSALRDTPAKIVAKQHVKDIDATITAQAIVNAAAKALSRAR